MWHTGYKHGGQERVCDGGGIDERQPSLRYIELLLRLVAKDVGQIIRIADLELQGGYQDTKT